jgi:hypothetical protein
MMNSHRILTPYNFLSLQEFPRCADLGKVLLHPSFGELPQWAVVGNQRIPLQSPPDQTCPDSGTCAKFSSAPA